ncbi:hypothetical protein NJ69_04800 [Pseudomonas parafulva]|nr:hypothetical protein NJ69_04800 [Pseudomonas parafulva]
MTDDFASLFARRCLDDCQIKAVTGVPGKVAGVFGELDEEGAGLTLAAGKSIEIAQQCGLVLTT